MTLSSEWQQAQVLADNGQFSAAIAHLEAILPQLQPHEQGRYWYQMGRWHQLSAQWPAAQHAFQLALAHKTAHAQSLGKTWHQLAQVYRATSQFTEAQAAYRAACVLLPEAQRGVSVFQLGNLLQQLGQWDAAAETLTHALKFLPEGRLRAEAYYHQGECFSRLRKIPEACVAYRAAEEIYAALHLSLWRGLAQLRLAMLSLRPDALDETQVKVYEAIRHLRRSREPQALFVAYELARDLCRLRGQSSEAEQWRQRAEALRSTIQL